MAVTNLYPNLPGHLVEFKDGGLQLTSDTTADASGKSLLILGTAFDGPINEPVKIDATTVSQLFGPEVNDKGYPNGATLTKYAKQAFKNGFTDVRCMRVTGSLASTTLSKNVVANVIDKDGVVTAFADGITSDVFIDVPDYQEGPMVSGTLNVSDAGNRVLVSSGSPFSDKIKVNAGSVRKAAVLDYSYTYKKYDFINATVDSTDHAAIADAFPVLNGDEILYTVAGDAEDAKGNMNIVNPTMTSDMFVDFMVADSTGTLIEGTHYEWTTDRKQIYFIGALASTPTNVTITCAKYTLEVVSDSKTVDAEDPQVIELPDVPVAGTVAVSYKTDEMFAATPVSSTHVSVVGQGVNIAEAASLPVGAAITVTYKYQVEEIVADKMTVRSMYGGSVYKEATVQVKLADDGVTKVFVFTKPASKKYTASESPLVYSSADYPTVGYLKQALKNTALNNVFEIVCDDDNMATADFETTLVQALTDGGDDGVVVTNDQMYEALSGKRDAEGYLEIQGAYQILENYNVDYIYPAGVYADSVQTVNPHSSFHHELALLCAVLTYRTKMTHGFIDVKPNSNTTLIGVQDYVKKLLQYKNDHFMKDENGDDIVDAQGNKMDIGWYTSCVVGPEPVMVSDTLGTYYGSPAIAYAALNASLKPESAPTNKPLPGVKGMKFKFSNKQMNDIVANRMVVFKLKNEGTTTASSVPYVVDGCTSGAANSDYTRLSTVKVVSDVVDQIREVADPFIGEPNTIEQRNALSALISKRLSYLLEKGEIQHYEFEINATIQQVLLGECSIALTLVCPMELRKITTVVALRAAA